MEAGRHLSCNAGCVTHSNVNPSGKAQGQNSTKYLYEESFEENAAQTTYL